MNRTFRAFLVKQLLLAQRLKTEYYHNGIICGETIFTVVLDTQRSCTRVLEKVWRRSSGWIVFRTRKGKRSFLNLEKREACKYGIGNDNNL